MTKRSRDRAAEASGNLIEVLSSLAGMKTSGVEVFLTHHVIELNTGSGHDVTRSFSIGGGHAGDVPILIRQADVGGTTGKLPESFFLGLKF